MAEFGINSYAILLRVECLSLELVHRNLSFAHMGS